MTPTCMKNTSTIVSIVECSFTGANNSPSYVSHSSFKLYQSNKVLLQIYILPRIIAQLLQ